MLKTNHHPHKSEWVQLLIRLLIIGQLLMLLLFSSDACSDMLTDASWFCDSKAMLDGSLDLINEFYTILCLVAVYIVYQFMLLVNIISHDYDAELIALDEFLHRLVNSFNPIRTLVAISKPLYLLIFRLQRLLKIHNFRLVNAEIESSYLPFV
ncbi:MAG: hypothetical protein EKK54_09940 [Neisseriaceae bacterium]|nr:MAG: hypothetical protein EKK54_09940 [Neisseriaceae bacterium]